MKILLTGGDGLLGTDLVAILKQKHQISKPDSKQMDIRSEEQIQTILDKSKPDFIIHAAAYTNVDGCEKEPEKAFKINAWGTNNIAVEAGNRQIPILYLSTDYVFNGHGDKAYCESDPVEPLNIYGMSKLMGEKYILKNTLKYYIVRTAWLYGRGGKNFVDTLLEKSKSNNEFSIVNDQIGSPTWAFDLSQAIERLIETNKWGIYHISNDGECSWYDFAKSIFQYIGRKDIKIHPVTSEQINRLAKRPHYSKLNSDTFVNTTGYRLPHWKDSLKKYIESKYT